MTDLILIRHGETDWNLEGRWQGQADVALNERGRAQAVLIAQELKDVSISAIYSSDLIRAFETAQELSKATGLPVNIDRRLREIHQGEWQGMLVADIRSRYADHFERRRLDPLNIAPPGGETVAQVRSRVLAAVHEIVSQHPSETVAIVSHGFALAVILAEYQGHPIDNVWKLIPNNGAWQRIEISSE
ncbi:MAG: histidine phosphatase family protein [Chloroflexi bacterium]|nr:histidine phosphatase family protein [Chloroflexota bacterium]